MIRDCLRYINIAKTTARRLNFQKKSKTENSVHAILAELCHQVDTDNLEQDQQTNYNEFDDVEMFQGIV